MTDLIKGCDISQLQGTNIDFDAVKLAGFSFCIFRCGIGNDAIDTQYKSNVASAKKAGLYVGAYQLIYPLPSQQGNPLRDPTAQAQYHFQASGGILPAFVDLEWPTQFGLTADGLPDGWEYWGCSASQITQWLLTYLQAYEKLSGQKPIIYTYPDYAESLNLPASFGTDYQLWIASYDDTSPLVPKPWQDWAMWQASGGAEKLPNGAPVDIDYVKDLSLWSSAVPPVTQPTPPLPAPIILPPKPTPVSSVVSPVSVPTVSFWQSILNFFGLG